MCFCRAIRCHFLVESECAEFAIVINSCSAEPFDNFMLILLYTLWNVQHVCRKINADIIADENNYFTSINYEIRMFYMFVELHNNHDFWIT